MIFISQRKALAFKFAAENTTPVMKHIVQKIERIKQSLSSGEVGDKSEVVELGRKAYSVTAGIFSQLESHGSPEAEFKNEYRFRSLHHLENTLQGADEIFNASGIEQLCSEMITALTLLLVVLEDEATAMDFAEAC